MFKLIVTRGYVLLLVSLLPMWGWANEAVLADPTQPLNYVAARRSVTLTLNSILHSGERKQAVINGKTVRENEQVDGAVVKRIEPYQVVVAVNGKQKTLRLRNLSIKKVSN